MTLDDSYPSQGCSLEGPRLLPLHPSPYPFPLLPPIVRRPPVPAIWGSSIVFSIRSTLNSKKVTFIPYSLLPAPWSLLSSSNCSSFVPRNKSLPASAPACPAYYAGHPEGVLGIKNLQPKIPVVPLRSSKTNIILVPKKRRADACHNVVHVGPPLPSSAAANQTTLFLDYLELLEPQTPQRILRAPL